MNLEIILIMSDGIDPWEVFRDQGIPNVSPSEVSRGQVPEEVWRRMSITVLHLRIDTAQAVQRVPQCLHSRSRHSPESRKALGTLKTLTLSSLSPRVILRSNHFKTAPIFRTGRTVTLETCL